MGCLQLKNAPTPQVPFPSIPHFCLIYDKNLWAEVLLRSPAYSTPAPCLPRTCCALLSFPLPFSSGFFCLVDAIGFFVGTWRNGSNKGFRGHKHEVCSVRFFKNNNKYICSGGSDKTVRIWNIETGKYSSHPLSMTTAPSIHHSFPLSPIWPRCPPSSRSLLEYKLTWVLGEEVWSFHCDGGIFVLQPIENNDILIGDSAGQICLLQLKNIELK